MENIQKQTQLHLVNYLRLFGTEKTSILISDAIDECGPVEGSHINWVHKEIAANLNSIAETYCNDSKYHSILFDKQNNPKKHLK